MGYVTQRTNPHHENSSTDTKTVTVNPSEEQRSVSYQAPTPDMQEYIRQNIIVPTAQAYGVNPDTGDVTPFQALGYNPEDERKRREAEMALNDRKRKENAWYNAFAVVGDALTAGLGGNVWQRQPNRIGAQANADNQRLIAEQKAEDMNNAAMMRNAGVKYADAVNRLIQNYLTKTTTTNKTGGGRTETTVHGPKNGYRVSTHVVGTGGGGSGSGRGSGGKSADNRKTISIKGEDGSPKTYFIPQNLWNDLIVKTYSKLSRYGFIDDTIYGVTGATFPEKEEAVRSTLYKLEEIGGVGKNGIRWNNVRGDVLVPLGRTMSLPGTKMIDGWLDNGWGHVDDDNNDNEENYDF